MNRLLLSIPLIALMGMASPVYAQKWWRSWETHPKVPEITAKMAKDLLLSGEKAVFVYAGYDVPEMVCGSLYIPYTLVPPYADGSRINLSSIPKDWWIFCYCP